MLYSQPSERCSCIAEKPFLDAAPRWNAQVHWVSLAWLRSMTLLVMTV